MKTFVLAATAVGILISALAAPATAKPNATGGTIKSQPAVSTDQAKPSKPSSKKLEYLKIDLKDVQVSQ
jgi:hypothetical protein